MLRFITLATLICLMPVTGNAMAESGLAESRVTDVSVDQAYQYVFAGQNVSAHYTPASDTDKAMLGFRRGSWKPRLFSGDRVRVDRTEFAELVSVTLYQVADLKTVTLTLLIPSINLNEKQNSLFATTALFTNHYTTIAGPELVEGPIQTFTTARLYAEASDAGSSTVAGSGVIGKVNISPTCGGPERPGQVCVGPLADVEVQILDEEDHIADTTMTDEQGFFSLRTEPGDFKIHIETPGGLPYCPETPVTIPEGFVSVTIKCDSGIR